MSKKRIISAVICILMIIPALCMQAFAADVQITDKYGLLANDELSELTDAAQSVAQKHSINIYILIDDYYDGSNDGSKYAMDFYNQKYGDELTDSVILTVDNFGGDGNRHVYILSSGRCSQKIDINEIEDITLELQYLIMDDDIYGCAQTFIKETDAKMSAEPVTGESGYDYNDGSDGSDGSDGYDSYTTWGYLRYNAPKFAVCLLIALVVGLAAVLIVRNSYKKFGISSAVDANAVTKMDLKVSTDELINKVVTTRVIPKEPPKNDNSDNFSGFSGGGDSGSGGGFSGGGRGF